MTRPVIDDRELAEPAPLGEEPSVPSDDASSRVVARPDGFHWVADDGQQEFGPFPTVTDALLAMRAGIETGLEPDETRSEAEAEIGYVEPRSGEEGELDQ